MTEAVSPVDKILERHGVDDPYEVVSSVDGDFPVGYSKDPSVRVAGSIHLMKRKIITRKAVEKILSGLRWF